MPRALRIDIRDKRLGDSGRLDISSGTAEVAERDSRRESVRALLDLGPRGLEIIGHLRAGRLSVEDVHRAIVAMDIGSLKVEEGFTHEAGPPRIPVMLGATIERFLLSVEGTTESRKTRDSYRRICRHLEAAFGVVRDEEGAIEQDVEVGSIDSEAASRFLHGAKKSIGGRRWAPRTQALAHAVAAQVWDLALTADEENAEKHGSEPTVHRNPWRNRGHRKGVKPARIRATRVEFLTRKEAARLLWAVRGTHLAAWVALGFYGGLRSGEKAHLRNDVDVDMRRGRLRIQPRKGKHPWRPKSDNGIRDVPIHRTLGRILRTHVTSGFAGSVYLFRPVGADTPITEATRLNWTRDAFERAGIRYGQKKDALTDHSLRHTFASWLTQRNTHPKKIAALMGDTVEIVMATYSHLVDDDLTGAINAL